MIQIQHGRESLRALGKGSLQEKVNLFSCHPLNNAAFTMFAFFQRELNPKLETSGRPGQILE